MLSFMIPTEEKGFNLNAVPQQNGAVYQVTNGRAEVKAELSAADAPARGSPNNNSHAPLLTDALDNMTSAAPLGRDLALTGDLALARDLALSRELTLTRDLAPTAPGSHSGSSSLLEDSYSDDTATEATLLLRADDRSDDPMTPSTENTHEAMTPSTDNTRSSPCGEDKPLLPLATVSSKTGKLKRVSFGSSKGSMVETVVYDYEPVQPLREEGSESPDPRSTSRHTFATSTPLSTPARAEPSAAERPASRVRVTYFESKKPLLVPAADPSDAPTPEEPDVPAPPPPGHTQVTTTTGEMPTTYIVQTIDAGWENPFRPGGELSKEADQIVRAIQSGRPLDASLDEADAPATTAVTGQPAHNGGPAGEPLVQATVQTSVAAAPPPPPTAATHRNGGAAQQTAVVAQPAGTVEVQHSLVKPEDASQVEQVTLKKKPRGKCCVVQ